MNSKFFGLSDASFTCAGDQYFTISFNYLCPMFSIIKIYVLSVIDLNKLVKKVTAIHRGGSDYFFMQYAQLESCDYQYILILFYILLIAVSYFNINPDKVVPILSGYLNDGII